MLFENIQVRKGVIKKVITKIPTARNIWTKSNTVNDELPSIIFNIKVTKSNDGMKYQSVVNSNTGMKLIDISIGI